ncbi:protein rep [Paenibacillus tuaregi]|uniref:protein rep n=1 Tax=Paenibacillus tuaregi TaxID=1816681 RepID=UPI00083925F4|nr:protein rep [Paenibacillus tuaregi]
MSEPWRRTLQYACANHRIISAINCDQQVNWLHLDLVLKQIPSVQLGAELDQALVAFNRLLKYKSVKQVTLGYFRMLEVRQDGDLSEARIHILLSTLKSYFQGRYYLKCDTWLSLWRKAMDREADNRVTVEVSSINGKSDKCHTIDTMRRGLQQMQQSQQECEASKADERPGGRRWIGYGKLLKQYLDLPRSGDDLDLGSYDMDDPVANRAFEIMLAWYPGIRKAAVR